MKRNNQYKSYDYAPANKKTIRAQTFGLNKMSVYDELINVYTADNKPLEVGDKCFFLLSNNYEYYIPIILRGTVIRFEFVGAQDRNYFILPEGIIDGTEMLEMACHKKNFVLWKFVKNGFDYKLSRTAYIEMLSKDDFLSMEKDSQHNFFNRSNTEYATFSLHCFFVRGYRTNDPQDYRKQLENMKTFRREYMEYITNDINNMCEIVKKVNAICMQ